MSELTLQIMQSVITKNDQVKVFEDADNGPIGLASALSDFFEICGVLESGQQQLDSDQLNEFGDYGMHLLDGLAMMVRRLEIMDQRENLARVYASLSLWLARRDAVLENLEGAADGFAFLTNSLNEPDSLAEMCHHMTEVIQSIAEKVSIDQDNNDPWRPWRVLPSIWGLANGLQQSRH